MHAAFGGCYLDLQNIHCSKVNLKRLYMYANSFPVGLEGRFLTASVLSPLFCRESAIYHRPSLGETAAFYWRPRPIRCYIMGEP